MLKASQLSPSVQGATVHKPLRHTTYFWLATTFWNSVFFLAHEKTAAGKDWRVENKFSWNRYQSRMYCFSSLYALSPIPLLCWGSSAASSIPMTLVTAPVIGGFSFCHVLLLKFLLTPLFLGHWMGWWQVQIFQTWRNIQQLPYKLIRYRWFIQIIVDCNDLWPKRCNGW